MDDSFYLDAVRPYCWFAAILLFLSYVIGLWFTLRTHAAVIWNNEVDEKRHQISDSQQLGSSQQPMAGPPQGRLHRHATNTSPVDAARGADIRDSQLYKKILGQSLKQIGLNPRSEETSRQISASEHLAGELNGPLQTPHMVPPKSSGGDSLSPEVQIPGFSEAQNTYIAREVAEMAATAATIAARDSLRGARKMSIGGSHGHSHTHINGSLSHRPPILRTATVLPDMEEAVLAEAATAGGHDAPNWSRMKSSVILMGATILYALIAEILVNTVDVVLERVAIDEKFLGITLFALVPNTTEFLVSPPSARFCHKLGMVN